MKRYRLITSFDCPHCAEAMDIILRQPNVNIDIDVVTSMNELLNIIPLLPTNEVEVPAMYDSVTNTLMKLPDDKYSLKGFLVEACKWKG